MPGYAVVDTHGIYSTDSSPETCVVEFEAENDEEALRIAPQKMAQYSGYKTKPRVYKQIEDKNAQ